MVDSAKEWLQLYVALAETVSNDPSARLSRPSYIKIKDAGNVDVRLMDTQKIDLITMSKTSLKSLKK